MARAAVYDPNYISKSEIRGSGRAVRRERDTRALDHLCQPIVERRENVAGLRMVASRELGRLFDVAA